MSERVVATREPTTAPDQVRPTPSVIAGVVLAAIAAAMVAGIAAAPAPVPGLPEPGPMVRLGLPAVRALLDVAAATVVGLSLLPKLLGFDRPDLTEPIMRRARPWTVHAAFLWAACALAAVVLQASEVLSPGEMPTLGQIGEYIDQVSAPKGLLISAGFALAAAGVGRLAVRFGESVPAELRIIVALFGLFPLPVTGHAAQWYWHDLSMISMELHVGGSALWTGGLVALLLLAAPNRGLLAEALPRFSRLATICLLVVTATGLINGLTQLALDAELPAGLVATPYGQLVIAKTVCLLAVAVLGAKIRWWLLPRVIRQERTSLIVWGSAEVAVMGLAYGIAVVLSRASTLI
ncbi:copper resistance D family protein [Acrocarpospora pleiomorpha]|uniref:copper resistance D family protein n=1 Tax=Acrocarpospora pleiomorpha TaxID=90975 RepID=UPI0031DE5F3E